MQPRTTRALVALRELILSGQLGAGEQLREVALSERLGVSRTPIRAALVQLADEGLVTKVGSSYVVRDFTDADIADAIEMRGVIEGTAARLAAERGVDESELARAREDVLEIEKLLRGPLEPRVAIERYLTLNASFHEQVSQLSESFVVRRMLEQVARLPFASANAFVIAESKLADVRTIFLIGNGQHRMLLEAIASREGTRAEAIAREHARLSLTTLRSVLVARASGERSSDLRRLASRTGT